MKNIYEDSHNIPAPDSNENANAPRPSGIIEEDSVQERDRRQFRSAEEKREKRASRLEGSAARRAERASQQQPVPPQQLVPPQQPIPPQQPPYMQVPQQPVQFVPVNAQYFIQQSPGQPPQLFTGSPANVPEGAKPTQPAQSYTNGMKIVYQSSDYDQTQSAHSQLQEGHTVYTQPTAPIAPEPEPPKPKYSAGHSFEEEIVKSGRFPIQKAKSFSVDDVAADGIKAPPRRFRPDAAVEEISLDTAKRNAPLKVTEKHVPIEKKEKTKSSASDKIRKLVLTLSILVALCSLIYLGYEWKLSKDNKELEEQLSMSAVVQQEELPTDDNNDDDEPPEEPESTTVKLSPDELLAKLKAENPDIVYPVGMQARFAQFYTDNQDFAGYLTINGLDVSLPIVQAEDDNEYLKKNFYGKKTKYGCPFVMHLNSINPLDKNTVIFGHYMKDGSIFAPLHKYKTIDGFRQAPVITFNTIYGDFQWKVIACIITNAYSEDDNNYVFRYYFTNLSSDEVFEDYIDALKVRSLYDTGVDVLPTDKLLTLSTCSYEFDNARCVVVARMVRTGESTNVDTSKATENDKPRYPQAYYNKKKLKNPYDDTYNWYVG